MPVEPKVTQIGEKLRLLRVRTQNTKTTCISVILMMPLLKNTAENTVLASFLAHASAKYPTLSRLNERLEELYGAILSADVSKLGEGYRLRFSLTCIRDDLALAGEERLSVEALRLLLELLFSPHAENGAFDKTQLETEVRLCVEDIESELNDKRAYALSRCLEIMCADEPFGVSKTELLEAVRAVTPESMFNAWQQLLREATVSVQVIGNVDFAPLEEMLREKLASQEGNRAPSEIQTVFVEAAEDVTEVTEEMDVNQSKLVLGFRTGMRDRDDDYFATRLMTDLFGGGPYSRLFMHVREKLSLCYYCSARLDRNKGLLMVQSGIERKNKDAAFDEIQKQLQVMQNGEFTDEEFAASKAALCDAFRGIDDTPEGLDAYYAMSPDGAVRTPEDMVKGLAAVTREDVVRAAKRLTLDTVYLLAGKEEAVNA